MTPPQDFAHSEAHPTLSDPVTERDHVRGPANAKVTLVEYGDFECPFCARAEPVLREVQRRFGDAVRLVFRHNPRAFDHAHAPLAAEAAEAAAEQGKFWEMHDVLFAHQSALGETDLVRYAEQLGLDVTTFRTALRERTHRARVREDEASGVRNHVIATPT